MKKALLITLTMAAAAIGSTTSYAADGTTPVGGDFGGGTINFTGSVTEAPCSITPGDDNQTINLGQVSQKLLKSSSGRGSNIILVKIRLGSCDLTAATTGGTAFTKASVTFTGPGIDETNKTKGYLSNNGTASNVAVQLTDSAGTAMDLTKGTSDVTLSTGDGNNIQFGAHMVNSSTGGTVTPGTVQAQVTYKLKYS